MNENGKFIMELPITTGFSTWETDTSILCTRIMGIDKGFEIFRYNLDSKKTQTLYIETQGNNASIYHYNPKYNVLYAYMNEDNKSKIIKIDTKTWQSSIIGVYEDSYLPFYSGIVKDRLLVNLYLKDTLTGKPCSINYRQHIALMNLDGTNERQVIIPE